MNPEVSVIIPVFNSEKYVTKAIESVFAQTYTNFNIIVVNDGSTDRSEEVMKPYIDRFTYITQQNKGPAAARNKGLRIAKGKYITFLDADDIWSPNKLELQTQILDKNNKIGLVHSDNLFLIKNNITTYTCKEKIKNKNLLEGKIFESLIMGKFFLTCSTVMVRKCCFDGVGLFDESLSPADDFEMWLRILQKWECAYINLPLVKYRIHSTNISRDYEKMHSSVLRVLQKIFSSYVLSEKIKKSEKLIWSNYYYSCGATYYDEGDFEKAKKALRKALYYLPLHINSLICFIKCMLGEKIMNELRLYKETLKKVVKKRS